MNNNIQQNNWSKNVILIDADYADKVAFNLIVNFERMLARRIPKASIALWIDYLALDGGIREGDNQIQVVLIHAKEKLQMDNFEPANYANDFTDKAFKDHLGEFSFNAYPAEEDIVGFGDFFADALQLILSQKEVERIMVIPNAEDEYIYNNVRSIINKLDADTKNITVFTMQPMPGGHFQQEILGYSLMAALGIKSDEIKEKVK